MRSCVLAAAGNNDFPQRSTNQAVRLQQDCTQRSGAHKLFAGFTIDTVCKRSVLQGPQDQDPAATGGTGDTRKPGQFWSQNGAHLLAVVIASRLETKALPSYLARRLSPRSDSIGCICHNQPTAAYPLTCVDVAAISVC